MKCNIIRGIAVSALLIVAPFSVASAADMALKAPPPPAPVWDWTGFYLGGDVGGYGSRQSATANPVPPGFGTPSIAGAGLAGFGLLPTSSSLNKSGVLGGPYAGYNWQMHNWLLGVEGDFTFLNLEPQRYRESFCYFPGRADIDSGTRHCNAELSNSVARLAARTRRGRQQQLDGVRDRWRGLH